MQKRVLKTLEYDRIIEQLCLRTASEIGAQFAAELEPTGELGEVDRLLTLTEEAETIHYRTGQSAVDAFPDMRECLKRLHAALYISPGELLSVARCLRAARMAREAIMKDESAKLLKNMASLLATHRSIEDEVNRCIIGEDEIFDGASPQLARIRRSMRLANERVREKLNAMIRSTTYQKYLQEPLVTIRNGRFVIPVKQEYRSQVPGLIHDQSGSGATLFIEPAGVVELGNEYKKLTLEEAEEIERILIELTAMIAPHAEGIYDSLVLLGEMDVIFAKAKLSREMNAVRPKLNRDGYVRIAKGRHPLIPKDEVVPIDLYLGRDFRILIITGPNTGGKTVTLKLVGLLALMAQSGLFIPALDGSEFPVFDAVYADIGDEQSIEQSLSTFSSHMTNIVDILNSADERSLVLLDELGAGTDPVEGAALAMSILEELHARRADCVCTTHYSEIKAFALTHDGMENASMEFDIDRLCPTYRLFIGIPGRSNAFEISKRLGLSERIIEDARKFLKGEDVKFEDVISSAHSQRRIAEEERRLAHEAREELERLRAETERERRAFEAEREKLKAKARDDARKIVSDSKREMERLIAEIRALKGIDRSAADRVIQQSRDDLRAEEARLAEGLAPAAREDLGEAPKAVKIGDAVRIVPLDQKATVLAPADAKAEVQVQAGIMKLMVKLGDLRLIKAEAQSGGASKGVYAPDRLVGLELDIRGKLVDEAVVIVDRYLDDAYFSGLSEVSIIHGKGTGALRTGVQSYLKKHPRVKSFRMGAYGEGDAGVTVVELNAKK